MDTTFNLLITDDLINIFSIITNAFNIRMSFFDKDMKEVVPLQIQPISDYCQMVQKELCLMEKCQSNDIKYCKLSKELKTTITYTCHAGLKETIFPIFIGNDILGFFIAGQVAHNNSIPDQILDVCRNHKESEILYEKYNNRKTIKEDKYDSIIKILEIITEYIIDKKLISIKSNLLTEKITNYLINNLEKNISSQDISDYFSTSLSTINKTLNKTVGLSLIRYSNRIKLEKACELMREDSSIRISEVAELVGFQDAFYFSRLFTKEYSISPKEYKKNLE